MKPLSGTSVFAWRMVGTFLGLLLLIKLGNKTTEMREFLFSLRASPKKGLMMIATTPIIASQFWLFTWAGVNGYAVDVSVGYILLPLTMVACAWLFIREPVSKMQWLALAFAALGVVCQLWITQTFSWATFWVCSIYPVYYLLRRQFGVPALLGLTFDLALIAPCALLYLLLNGELAMMVQPSKFWLLIPVLGILSALAMQLNLDACRLLPVPMFGMLSYFEPAMMFVLSITVLGEPVSSAMMLSFALIGVGLSVSILESGLQLRKKSSAFSK